MSDFGQILKVNLATNQAPTYSIDKVRGIVKQGKKNDYSNYLVWLYDNHAEHSAIIRGKSRYISGLSIHDKESNATVEQFLLRANPFETVYELTKKTDTDDVMFGGYYLKIESNAEGKPISFYHVDYCRVRASDDLCHFKVCNDWSKSYNENVEIYPMFKEGYSGTSILYVKNYSVSESKLTGAYSDPEYQACTLDIDTDIRVGSFFNNFIKNNWSAGTMVTIFNGETDPAKKANIVNRLNGEYSGEDNAGKVFVAFAPKDAKASEVLTLNANDLAEQYAELNKRNKEKIVAGHNIPAQIFNIKVDDKALFSRSEIIEGQEIFQNTYVSPKQKDKTDLWEWLCLLSTGVKATLVIEKFKLIGLELPLDNQNVINALNSKNPQIIIDYLIEKYSIKIPEQTSTTGQSVQETSVNENLKNLTGRQFQGLMRIVKKYDDEKISKESAIALMRSGFGVSEQEALTFLNIADEDEAVSDKAIQVQQNSQEKNNKIKELFTKYAHDINTDDEVLEKVYLNDVKFANVSAMKVSITELRNAILEKIKGNPFLSVFDLAKDFKVEETLIQENINWLAEKRLIDVSEGNFTPTEKAIGKETEPIETEIYTEYTYQLRPDLVGQPLLLSTSRQDCKDWVKMTRNNAITYEAIQKLENEFGDSAWDFRGGFFNNNGEITPWCRHIWEGETKLRRKKG
jgi:hypothetical protein